MEYSTEYLFIILQDYTAPIFIALQIIYLYFIVREVIKWVVKKYEAYKRNSRIHK